MLYTRKTFGFEHSVKDADCVLVGIPFDSTEIGRPVRYGPLFIRESIKNLEGHDPETEINPFAKLKFTDVGDVEIVPGSWKLTRERIVDTVKEILESNKNIFPVFLGGEHLITYGILEAFLKFYKKLTVVHIDAHRDLFSEWMGNKYSHITWAYRAVKDFGIDLRQIGFRIWRPEEEEFARKNKIKEDLTEIKNPVYLTVDIDVLDPSVAPEVGTPEPNGMYLENLLILIRDVFKNKVIGMDVVECASDALHTNTALSAAYIIKKSLCYYIKNKI